MIEPILDEMAGDHGERVTFAKLNVDDNPQTAARFNVLSIPMVILFEGGEAQETVVGARPRSHYEGAWATLAHRRLTGNVKNCANPRLEPRDRPRGGRSSR